MVVGVGKEPLTLSPGMMVGRELSAKGAITGTAIELEKALKFSLLADVRARIEQRPLTQARAAYDRMRSGQATFRVVLTVDHE